MKKICICTTISTSIDSFVLPTAKMLHDKHGLAVTLICGDENIKTKLPKYINFIKVPMRRGIDPSCISTIFQLVRIFKENKYDIVQYSTPNASFYASVAAKIAKTKIRLYHQWGIRYVGMAGIKRLIFKKIEKITCKLSTDIRAVSQKNMEFGIREGLYDDKKVKVIGNGGTIGVDLKSFNLNNKKKWRKEIRNRYGISKNCFVYGYSGRITKDKGCNELLSSFKEISSDSNKLLLIGSYDKNNGLKQELIDYANKDDNIVMTGRVDNNSIAKYYAAIDILIHPTYREGFGMVLQEAGAMEVPAITTNIPGASEVMDNGKSIIIIEPKNEKELLEAMKNAQNRKSLLSLGKQARIKVEKTYERTIMLSNQEKDYGVLLEKL